MATFSVSCSTVGIFIAVLAGTPVGSTIVEVEFFLRGKHEWPKDFPEEFSSITLTGRLEIARNGDGTARPRLVDADMSWASR